MPKKPFWSEGIRFQCQGTGRCCVSRGGYGYVYLNLEDRRRFAKYFKISTAAFTKKFCTKTDGWFHLKDFTNACQFLKGTSCKVYRARPNQCRTWPFWPENMNARTWSKEVKTYCPGIGKGRLYSPKEIRAQMALDPLNED
jgi:Fe-S-cluster containining protein